MVVILLLIVEFLLYIIVHVLGNRYKKFHVYGMFLLYTTTMTHVCVSQFLFRAHNDKFKDDMTLRGSYEYLARTFAFFCLYAVPNIKWLILYMMFYIVLVVIITVQFGDFSNSVFNETLSA